MRRRTTNQLLTRCVLYSVTGIGAASLTWAAYGDEVVLTSGERLTGEVTAQNDQNVTLNHPVLGTLQIDRENITAVNTAGGGGEADAPAETPPSPPHRFSTWVLPSFTKSFEAGFNGSNGNSENFSGFLAFNADRKTDTETWNINARYFRSSSDGETSQNEFNSTLLREWLRPEQDHFWFARGTYEYDQFTAWDHRVGAYGGVGYQFLDDDVWQLKGRAGAGPQYEFGDVNELTWEALLELEGSYQIDDGHELSAYNRFFPSLSEGGEYRNITGIAWSLKLDQARGLSLKLGVENKYESDPEAGQDRNDIKYYGALVFDF